MAYKQVMALRKEGRLDEALALAEEDMARQRDKWSCGALFWVLRDMARRHIDAGRDDLAAPLADRMAQLLPDIDDNDEVGKKALNALKYRTVPYLKEILHARDLSHDPATVAEAYNTVERIVKTRGADGKPPIGHTRQLMAGWVIVEYLKQGVDTLDAASLKRALALYFDLDKVERPSALHSQVLYYAVAVKNKYPAALNFERFMRLWGLANLTDSDWATGKDSAGRTYPSLAQRAVSKWVRDHRAADRKAPLGPELEDLVVRIIKQRAIGANHFKRLLAIEYQLTGRTDKALAAYRKVARSMRRSDYVWRELAELLTDADERLGALCKAILTARDRNATGYTRLQIVGLLLDRGQREAAALELELASRAMRAKGREPGRLYQRLREAIPAGVKPAADNTALYQQWAAYIDSKL